MRRLLAICVLSLLVVGLGACSDSDDGEGASSDDSTSTDDSTPEGGQASGEAAELCAVLEDQADLFEGNGEDGPTEEALAALDEAIESAPPVIKPDLETVRDTFVEISELDEDDLASFDEAFDLLFDPEFIGAIEQVGLYLETECGLDIETPSEGALEGGDDEDAEGDDAEAGDLDTDALREYVTAEDAAIEERFQSVVTVDGLEISVGVRDLDDPEEAVAICEILAGYAYDEVGDSEAEIKVNDTSGATLASRDGESGECEAA